MNVRPDPTPAGRRIVMFSNLYPPVVSGSSTQSSMLAAELARRGCDIAVITARVDPDSAPEERIDKVSIYRLPALKLPRLAIALNFPWLNCTFTPANWRRINSILDAHRPDVLHLHNHMFDLAFSAALARRKRGLPLVVTIHTMIKHSNALYNLLLYPLDRGLLRRTVVNSADAVLCPDQNIKTYVADAFRRPEAEIVPYGISLAQHGDSGLADRLRKQHGLDGKRVILSLGHVHAIRNRKTLVEALPLIHRSIPNAVLVLVGAVSCDTPMRIARELGVVSAVRFTGPVPHDHIPAYLSLADLEAHWLNQDIPGRTSLGIASLEAMSAGKVVLAAANEQTYGPGILKNGENVVLVDPHDAEALAKTITELLRDDRRRAAIGKLASQTVRAHFSWNSICQKTLDVYDRLTGHKQTVRRAA
jgi:1,2-diacylglycerol 3-alpha-glucosyltransferase